MKLYGERWTEAELRRIYTRDCFPRETILDLLDEISRLRGAMAKAKSGDWAEADEAIAFDAAIRHELATRQVGLSRPFKDMAARRDTVPNAFITRKP